MTAPPPPPAAASAAAPAAAAAPRAATAPLRVREAPVTYLTALRGWLPRQPAEMADRVLTEDTREFLKHVRLCTAEGCTAWDEKCRQVKERTKHWNECDRTLCTDCVLVDASMASLQTTGAPGKYDAEMENIKNIRNSVLKEPGNKKHKEDYFAALRALQRAAHADLAQ